MSTRNFLSTYVVSMRPGTDGMATHTAQDVSTAIYRSGPEVIKLFSCSTQLSMKFHLVIKVKIPKIKTFFMLNSAEHAQLS